jgi:hypothetical protein
MKTVNIAKMLSVIALAALAAGSAQANGFGPNPFIQVTLPIAPIHAAHRDFDDRFDRDYFPHHDSHASIDQRQHRQMERIREGMAHGQISRHEAHDLMRDQRVIEQTQRRYLADGRISRDEWRQLDSMLDRAGQEIRAEKHDYNRH